MSRKRKDLKPGIEALFGGPPEEKAEENVGRASRAAPEVEQLVKTTVRLPPEDMARLKALAFWDRKPLREVLTEAFQTYCSKRGDDIVREALDEYNERQKKGRIA